ncbi:MAG TPA: hypothetical protein VL651_05935 [Bacteroidia bacterium]|jgi:hypothetical protein|nr:hypothetical protein [Bacteroidia bacterium]
MKKFIVLLAATITSSLSFAQDTLVSKNGTIIPGFITESDSSLITYTSDTSSHELNIVQRIDLLMIKHRDGKTEQFYHNDTMITMNGSFVLCKILEISPDFITSFSYNGKVNDLVMTSTSEIFMLRMNDGSTQLIDHHAANMSGQDSYKLGEKDARKYFKTSKGAIAGSVACGTGTYVYFTGLVGEVFVARQAPANLHNQQNPNDQLLDSNPDYRSGYLVVAQKKKKKDCWKAYGCGVLLPVAAIVAVGMAFNGDF